jgi:UDP-glucose 4-epimerase
MTITQAIRRAGRIPVHIPQPALEGLGRAVRLLRFGGFSATQVGLLTNSRVLDTTTLRRKVGFTPAFSTVAAFDDFVTRLRPVVDARWVRGAELRVAAALGVPAEPDGPWSHPSTPSVTGKRAMQRSPDPGSIAAGRLGSGSPPARRLFSVGGDGGVRSPGGAARPGSRQR